MSIYAAIIRPGKTAGDLAKTSPARVKGGLHKYLIEGTGLAYPGEIFASDDEFGSGG